MVWDLHHAGRDGSGHGGLWSDSGAVVRQDFIEVIVSPCRWNGETWALCGSRIHESKHSSPSEALKTAMLWRSEGRSVIIRPSFIESFNGADSYREWRSFNDGSFREIRWYCGGIKPPDSIPRADYEVVLPELPVPGFSEARQWVILCAEEAGYQKIAAQVTTLGHAALCQWVKETYAVAVVAGQNLLLEACREYAKELGTNLPVVIT